MFIKRNALSVFTAVCTATVTCFSLMAIAALGAKLIPRAAVGAVFELSADEVSESAGERLTEPVSDAGLDDSAVPVIDSAVKALNLSRYTKADVPSVFISNQTDYTVDADIPASAVSAGDIYGDKPTVLIYHTHGTEGYNNGDIYDEYADYHSNDITANVVAAGSALASALEKLGVKVIHDTEMYDSEDYSGAYGRSRAAVEGWLEKYPSIRYTVDVHRDSVKSEGREVKLICDYGGKKLAQIMLVVGTDAGGNSHKGWRDNFAAAIALQKSMNELCPTLARPVYVRTSHYNQDLSKGGMLVEIGSCGNTLEEAVAAAEMLAKSLVRAFGKSSPA